MSIFDIFLKRSDSDGNIIPLQFYDNETNDMQPVTTGNPLPVMLDDIVLEYSDDDKLNCNANLQINDNDISASNPLPVMLDSLVNCNATLQSGGNNVSVSNPLPTTSIQTGKTSSATHTRPNDTTAYDALDVVGTDPATNLTFENVYGVAGAEIIINRVELEIDVAAIPSGMSGFKLHLYNAAPTAITDKSPFNLPVADRTKYLGSIVISTPEDLGDTLYISDTNVNFQCKLADSSTTLYGQLVTLGGYTPTASAVKKVIIHTLGA